jgi:YfiR/HmsC-like
MQWMPRDRELESCPGRYWRSRAGTALLLFAAVGLILRGGYVFAEGGASSEYQIKAAFLYHFAQFVDWPPEAFKDDHSPLTYCTVGEDPFRGALEASLNGKTIGTRPLRVLHFRQAAEVQGCQVLFVGALEQKSVPAALASFKEMPVLTVGESEHFAEDGGIIGFCLEDNKVRFEINVGAAQRAKLRISATLLALAKTVLGGPKGS